MGFLLIWLQNALLTAESEFLSLKMSILSPFCRPLGSAARGGCITRHLPPPHTPNNARESTSKREGKVNHSTGHEGPEGEQMYSSTLSPTSALDEGGWSTPRPGRFTHGKHPVPIV